MAGLEVGPWEEGRPTGTVAFIDGCYCLRLPIAFRPHRPVSFSKSSHGSAELAESIANELRDILSLDLGLTRNQRRRVRDPITLDEGCEITLTQGKTLIIDVPDIEKVSTVTWATHRKEHTSYAVATIRGKSMMIHTFLTGWEKVDHIDGDGLNNRRRNIRPTTTAENARNLHGESRSSTGVTGVYRLTRGGCALLHGVHPGRRENRIEVF